MILSKIISSLLIKRCDIPTNILPSQGLFYPSDMIIKIKQAEIEDIFEYEQKYDANDLLKSIDCVKQIVKKNTSFNKKYSFDDLKSLDVIFLFLEIVKFTKEKEIYITYVDLTGKKKRIPFNSQNFNYFDFEPFLRYYDSDTRELVMDGYRFSFPSIGVENSLTRYLISLSDSDKIERMKNISFEFLFFLTGKNYLSDQEIDNLVQIFNFDLDENEKNKLTNIINQFSSILAYSLKTDGLKIEMKSSMNLQSIWDI